MFQFGFLFPFYYVLILVGLIEHLHLLLILFSYLMQVEQTSTFGLVNDRFTLERNKVVDCGF